MTGFDSFIVFWTFSLTLTNVKKMQSYNWAYLWHTQIVLSAWHYLATPLDICEINAYLAKGRTEVNRAAPSKWTCSCTCNNRYIKIGAYAYGHKKNNKKPLVVDARKSLFQQTSHCLHCSGCKRHSLLFTTISFSEKYGYIVYDCHADKPWYFSCSITVPNKWFTYNHRLHYIHYIIYNTTCDTNYNVEIEFGWGLLRTIRTEHVALK